MYQQSFYKLNDDINDTLSKLIPGEKIVSYLELLGKGLLTESDQLDLAYYIHTLYTSGNNPITIVNTSDLDSPYVVIISNPDPDFYQYMLENRNGQIFLNISCYRDFSHMAGEPDYYPENFCSVDGTEIDIPSVLQALDSSVEAQSFLLALSEVLMNEQFNKNDVLNILNEYRSTNNYQIREIMTSISYFNDTEVSNPASWLSIFTSLYKAMSSCVYSQGSISFNTEDYTPMFSWRTVFAGAISTLATVVNVVGGAIGAVLGLLGKIAGSVLNTVWDATAEMKIDFHSSDVCFAQPLGFCTKNSVNGFAWGTNTIDNKIVQVCSPVFKRFLWNQDSKLYGECYARISFTPKQIRKILGASMFNILNESTDAISSYHYSNFSYEDICELYNTADADGYHNAIEYLSDSNVSNKQKDACVFMNIMLALWCSNPMYCLSDHNQSQVYDSSLAWTQNFAVNMLNIYNKASTNNPVTWLQFYDPRYFYVHSSGIWNDDTDPVDDIDHATVSLILGIAPNRNKPFITPPKIAKELIVYSTILAGVIVAATITTGIVAKRAWRKHCLYQSSKRRSELSSAKDSFNNAVYEYTQGSITEQQLKTQFNSFYKQSRKYNFWASLHGLSKYDMINDFDLDTSGVSFAGIFGSSYSGFDDISAIKKLITG